MLARGVKGKHDRDLWLLWEEGVPPALVFEITSRSTRREDTGRKKDLYEKLGVSELILFDPYGEYLKPRLQGFRLDRDGRYHPTPLYPDGSLDLKTTGLMVRPEGERLRLVDPATGEKLLWEDEEEEARRRDQAARRAAEERAAREAAARREEAAARAKAEERAVQEAAARAAAEEQVRALTEELARLRAQSSKPS
jgi:hypothetical protein